MKLMDKAPRQNINKKIVALNDTGAQTNFIDIFRTFHPKAAEYTFFSSGMECFLGQNTFGHKTNLNKFKKIKIILSIFSDHNAIKLNINHKYKTEKSQRPWKINNMLLINVLTMR